MSQLVRLAAAYLTNCLGFEYQEEVDPVLHLKQAKVGYDVPALALDAAHSVAFHTGLGASVYPSPSTSLKGYLDEHKIAAFADSAYNKSNIAVVGDGASTAALTKWTEQFFKNLPSGSAASSAATTYYGGESRTAHKSGNSVVIAFPGSSFGTFKPETAVLAALLGGQSSVKWAPGFSLLSKVASASPALSASATNLAYSDAGLFTIQISGPAAAVRAASQEAAKALKSIAEGNVSKEDLTKAIARAKFDALASSESGVSTVLQAGSGIVHTGKPFQIAETAKSIEGVSADSLKSVSGPLMTYILRYGANYVHRLLRRSWMARPRSPPLVTCMFCHMLRSLVLRYRRRENRRQTCTNISAQCCNSRLVPVHIVNSLEVFFSPSYRVIVVIAVIIEILNV